MSRRWPLARLGKYIRQRKDFVIVEDDKSYRRVTVRLRARGIEERDIVRGSGIKTKKQFPTKAHDLLVAEIDAKVGGYGIVPPELEGAIVSSHYYMYEVDKSALDIRFLGYWLQTTSPLEQIQQFIRGALNYAAIRPYHFPELLVPVPSLDEQRGIADKIDQIATRADEARRLLRGIEDDQTSLLLRRVEELSRAAPRAPMAEVAPVVRRPVDVQPSEWYPELGIRSFGKGTFHKEAIKGSELGSKRLYRIEPGDLLFSNVFSWEGAIAVVQPEDKGRFGSHRFITCVPDPDRATAEFLCYYFLTDEGLADIRAASPGAAGRNKTLGVKKLEEIKVPLPPVTKQRDFCELLRRLRMANSIHGQTAASLDHFMPALLDHAFRGEL